MYVTKYVITNSLKLQSQRKGRPSVANESKFLTIYQDLPERLKVSAISQQILTTILILQKPLNHNRLREKNE